MEIAINDLKSAIKRHLSVIGKRLYDKDGKNLFSNITTSTAEDPLLVQYIETGAKNVETALLPLVVDHDITSQNIDFTLLNTRRDETEFESRCYKYIVAYITLFSVGEYLAMVHPDMAAKYRDDAAGSMQSLVAYAFYKEPPTASTSSYADINGTFN